MASLQAAAEALAWAEKASRAMEEAGKNFGMFSQEARLARAAYEHLMDDYEAIVESSDSPYWKQRCKDCPSCRGCKDYDA